MTPTSAGNAYCEKFLLLAIKERASYKTSFAWQAIHAIAAMELYDLGWDGSDEGAWKIFLF